jgi:hypothetical protein
MDDYISWNKHGEEGVNNGDGVERLRADIHNCPTVHQHVMN